MILQGDCRDMMPLIAPFDLIIADPPYGVTSLTWDRYVKGWLPLAADSLKPTGSIWLFGSLRFLLGGSAEIDSAGLRYAQDIVWEKHNGSGFQADRFRRVHEHVVQLYRKDTPWRDVFNCVQYTPDATKRTVRAKGRPTHMGHIDRTPYVSEDGGPRLMRSVLQVRSTHGRAIHPTEKPVELLETLIRTSCPEGGVVADWFAGSGAVGEACRRTGRQYVGCEIDPLMAVKARARLSEGRPRTPSVPSPLP